MNSTLKTSLVIILVLLFTFTLIYFYVDSFSNYIYKNRTELESKFYSQLDNDKKKIFFVGSSHVGRLNQTYVQEYLHNNNVDYEVYNLAFGAETPWDRSSYIDSMIAAKPALIVYGVGYRDFMDAALQFDSTIPEINLPNPSLDFKYGMDSLGNFLNYDFNKFRSPQIVFRYLIRDNFDLNTKQDNLSIYEKTKPFYPVDQRETVILNNTQLQKLSESWNFKVNSMPSYNKNQNAYALSQTIEKFNKNKIKVIIFSTPHTKYYTDNLPLKFTKEFDNILQRFSQDVHVYQLRDKYIDLPIWSDTHHIAVNPKSLVYSTDIAKIILNETGP